MRNQNAWKQFLHYKIRLSFILYSTYDGFYDQKVVYKVKIDLIYPEYKND